MPKQLLALGIETSCDETAAAIVDDGHDIRSSVVASQVDLHARFGGVVPEIASRAHAELVSGVIAQALVSPAAAQRRVRRLAEEVRARVVPAGGDIPTRVDGVVDLLFRAMPLAPRSLPGAVTS